MISVKQSDIKDYLDWVKILLTISSTAVGALLLKFEGAASQSSAIKLGAILFLAALVFFILSYAGLVEHKNNTSPRLSVLAGSSLLLGWGAFILAFSALVVAIF